MSRPLASCFKFSVIMSIGTLIRLAISVISRNRKIIPIIITNIANKKLVFASLIIWFLGTEITKNQGVSVSPKEIGANEMYLNSLVLVLSVTNENGLPAAIFSSKLLLPSSKS